jgi:hypothetical protein
MSGMVVSAAYYIYMKLVMESIVENHDERFGICGWN